MTSTTGLSEKPLDIGHTVQLVSTPAVGGIALFIGTVRESPAAPDRQAKVVALEYEAHPELAPTRLDELAGVASEKWDLRGVAAIHRTGRCPLGEPTVVVACAAPHRKDALEACHWLIDEIKATVPIWKREIYSDGSAWVEAPAE